MPLWYKGSTIGTLQNRAFENSLKLFRRGGWATLSSAVGLQKQDNTQQHVDMTFPCTQLSSKGGNLAVINR